MTERVLSTGEGEERSYIIVNTRQAYFLRSTYFVQLRNNVYMEIAWDNPILE